MNRFQAGATHLAISALIATAVFLPVYFIWYPDVMFESAGGRDLFLLIAAVDVTLGPLITTIVFRSGKWGMKFDLAVIGILQVAALSYGVLVLFESRPVYVVFVKDRFELVRATQVPEENLEKVRGSGKEHLPVLGPQLVAAKLPTDPDEKFKMMISGIGGVDVQSYPEYHVPYDSVRADVRASAKPLARLRELNPGEGAKIDSLIARTGKAESSIGFVPLRAGKVDLAVLVDTSNGDVLRYASLRPWAY
jgi:hypothetical protein